MCIQYTEEIQPNKTRKNVILSIYFIHKCKEIPRVSNSSTKRLWTPTWLIFRLQKKKMFPLLLRTILRKHLTFFVVSRLALIWALACQRSAPDRELIINESDHLPFMRSSRFLIKLLVYSFLLIFTAFKRRKVKWSHWSWSELRPGSRKSSSYVKCDSSCTESSGEKWK